MSEMIDAFLGNALQKLSFTAQNLAEIQTLLDQIKATQGWGQVSPDTVSILGNLAAWNDQVWFLILGCLGQDQKLSFHARWTLNLIVRLAQKNNPARQAALGE